MKRWVLVALVLASLLPTSAAYACSCMMPGSPAESLAQADAVFSGRVDSIETPANYEAFRVHIDVDQIWKGAIAPAFEVRTARDSAGCGYNFEQGKSYLIYAYQSEGSLTTNLCSRSTTIDLAGDDLAALGAGTPAPAAPAGGTSIQWPLVALGVLLLGVGVVITLRRARRTP